VAGAAAAWLAPSGSAQAGTGRGSMGEAVDAVASRLDHALIELRRDIHLHPEAAGQERRTAAVVARRLRAAGLSVTTGVGGHGVVAVLDGARPGRTVAYRADMDAVPPDEQIGGGTALAHLCGHDIHTTVGIGVAQVLSSLRDRVAGRIVFLFQPGEEALIGAQAMLDDGVLHRFNPAEIHALHCGPFPVGQFVVAPGTGLPGQDRGTISLVGPDATVRAGRLVAQINEMGTVAQPSSPADLENLVAAAEIPHGPLERFVYMQARAAPGASGVDVRFSYRCWPAERYTEVRTAIDGLARSAGSSVAFPHDPFPAVVTPVREGRALQRHLERSADRDQVKVLHAAFPYNGDDFALFLDQIPGTYSFLGVRRPGAGIETSYPHYVTFEPDERAIGHGVRTMAEWLAVRAAPGREKSLPAQPG
jgi:amidohydrolase